MQRSGLSYFSLVLLTNVCKNGRIIIPLKLCITQEKNMKKIRGKTNVCRQIDKMNVNTVNTLDNVEERTGVGLLGECHIHFFFVRVAAFSLVMLNLILLKSSWILSFICELMLIQWRNILIIENWSKVIIVQSIYQKKKSCVVSIGSREHATIIQIIWSQNDYPCGNPHSRVKWTHIFCSHIVPFAS